MRSGRLISQGQGEERSEYNTRMRFAAQITISRSYVVVYLKGQTVKNTDGDALCTPSTAERPP